MLPKIRRSALLALLLALPPAVPAAAAQEASPARGLEPFVDSLMAEYDRDGSPGAAIGVIRGGEATFAKGYGMADLGHAVPITAETKFNLGSAAKQFMAFAFALLESRGELSLDDPVSEYLPEWPEFEQRVTLRHLLTHTSGYREAYGTLTLAGRIPGRDYMSRDEALEVVRRQPELEFPAGSEWKYNSTAWIILAEAAERVTGEPMAAWMQENVFGPLEMEHTAIESRVGQVISGAAYSYTGNREDGFRMEWSNRAIFGAAEVYTTVRDLARWFRNFRTGELGGPAVQEAMRERFVLTGGDTTDYSLGLFIDEHRGLRRIGHGGSHAGFRAQLSYYPELDAGVVVMSNHGRMSSGRMANRIAEFAFEEHMAPEESPEQGAPPAPPGAATAEAVSLDSAALAAYAGTYRSEDGQVYDVEAEDGGLEVEGQIVLTPVSDSVFRAEGPPVIVAFHQDEAGTVSGATVWEGEETSSLRRVVEPWDPPPAELEAYTGRYYSPELETIYTLRVRDGRLISEHRWNGTFRYQPTGRGEFQGRPGPTLRFERNRVGLVTGFCASVGRTEDVWFAKR